MERFTILSLHVCLREYNKYKGTNLELTGVYYEQGNKEKEMMFSFQDSVTKEIKEMYLFEFRDKLLGEIKNKIKDRINNNEFKEAQKLIEHCENVENILG